MTDSAGHKITTIRDPQRNLTAIQAPDGASIRLTYDNQSRVVRAEGSGGNWARYTYDSAGHLTEVAHSDGTMRYYFYENGLLTWIRDENKRVLLHNIYNSPSDWLASQQFSDGSTIRYRYDL
jgi:YD repeat-containing protein